MKKSIDIQSRLSAVQKNTLLSSISQQLWRIYVKRHSLSPISISSFSLKEVTVAGQEICLMLGNSKIKHKLCFSSSTQSIDDYGEYEQISIDHLDVSHSESINLEEHCSIPIQFPFGNSILQIDVYGIGVEALERRDEDFPKEVEILNVNIDNLFKIKLKDGSFFIINAKAGFVLLRLFKNEDLFEQYIAMTQESWGKEYGYIYKYTLE